MQKSSIIIVGEELLLVELKVRNITFYLYVIFVSSANKLWEFSVTVTGNLPCKHNEGTATASESLERDQQGNHTGSDRPSQRPSSWNSRTSAPNRRGMLFDLGTALLLTGRLHLFNSFEGLFCSVNSWIPWMLACLVMPWFRNSLSCTAKFKLCLASYYSACIWIADK